MEFKSRKAVVLSLVAGILLCLPPSIAFAAEDVCQIIDTDGVSVVGTYDDLADALTDVLDGQTIQLLDDIAYTSAIVISGKSITFAVNGFTLNVTVSTGHALDVGSGGEVMLDNSAGGAFNVRGGSGNSRGVYAHDGGKAAVTNANTNGGANTGCRGVFATGDGSTVTVYGNVMTGFYAVEAQDGAIITVLGNVSGGGGMIVGGTSTKVFVEGNCYGGGVSVLASNGVTVNIGGNVSGNIGVMANTGAQVTVNGTISASAIHITVDGVDKTLAEHELTTSKPTYFEYTNGASNVWAKAIRITTQPVGKTVSEGSITESLVCVATGLNGAVPTYQWYSNTTDSNTGGTPIGAETSSTFDLPTTLAAVDSPYYYYCVVSASGASEIASDVAIIMVEADGVADEFFTVTINGSYAGAASGTGEYEEGDIVTINAGTRNGYTFAGWTVNAGGANLFAASGATTTFVMPANDVTITANWSMNSDNNTPSTGDSSALFLCVAVIALSVTGIGFVSRRAKPSRQKQLQQGN